MSLITGVIAVVFLLWIGLRTIGFAVWNWKNENLTGSVLIILLSIASVALPVYVMFFRS